MLEFATNDETIVAPHFSHSNRRRIIVLWLVTRVWLSLWALLCSTLYPITRLEEEFNLWPPRAPFGDWLARVLLAPWNRWDVEHFLKIATQGYHADDGTLAFHPLYPLLGKAVGVLVGGHALWGLFIVSNVCSLLFLLSLERLARLHLSRAEAYRACFFFTMLPPAFVLFAPYTEPLFLLCSVLTFLLARNGRWWQAGLAGGLAALTRQQGILLLLPLVWEFWAAAQWDWRVVLRRWRSAMGLLLTPLGLGLWLLYRNFTLGDTQFNWREPYTFFYGLLISPSATKIIATQKITFPWEAIGLALHYPTATNLLDLLLGSIYLLLLIIGWRKLWQMRPAYLLYALITIVVSFSLSTGLPNSYLGLARHCLLAFPLVLPLAMAGQKKSVKLTVVLLGALWLLALTYFYVSEVLWLP